MQRHVSDLSFNGYKLPELTHTFRVSSFLTSLTTGPSYRWTICSLRRVSQGRHFCPSRPELILSTIKRQPFSLNGEKEARCCKLTRRCLLAILTGCHGDNSAARQQGSRCDAIKFINFIKVITNYTFYYNKIHRLSQGNFLSFFFITVQDYRPI